MPLISSNEKGQTASLLKLEVGAAETAVVAVDMRGACFDGSTSD